MAKVHNHDEMDADKIHFSEELFEHHEPDPIKTHPRFPIRESRFYEE